MTENSMTPNATDVPRTLNPRDPYVVWDECAQEYYRSFPPAVGRLTFGPLVPSDDELRLIGSVEGRTVLDLGCGAGANAVYMAKRGAHVIATDFSKTRTEIARRLAQKEEVRIELRTAEPQELVFVPAGRIDMCLCVGTLNYVADWGRVFRAVERVLAPGGSFVLAVEHPIWAIVSSSSGAINESYANPMTVSRELVPGNPRTLVQMHNFTVSGILSMLSREGLQPTSLLEPPIAAPPTDPHYRTYPPELAKKIPPVLIVKAERGGRSA